jgi:DNA-binding NarL/FixJ family response regulator
MIRMVVVDDQPLARLGLRMLIETEEDLELVGEAEDGRAALDLIRRTRPDVVLLDIRIPALDGPAALKEIIADPELAHIRVVMIISCELDEYFFEALRAGASGFFVDHAEPAELLRVIRVVAAGRRADVVSGEDSPANPRMVPVVAGTGDDTSRHLVAH